jgi:hypothetical protein
MSPRRAFINNRGFVRDGYLDETLLSFIYDIFDLASTHDPDHAERLSELERRLNKLEARVDKVRHYV